MSEPYRRPAVPVPAITRRKLNWMPGLAHSIVVPSVAASDGARRAHREVLPMLRHLRTASACFLAVTLATPSLACPPRPYAESFQKHLTQVRQGIQASVDFASHSIGAQLSEKAKESVRAEVAKGPNFAGKFRLVGLEC